jgi:hypothetical protein
MSRDALDMDQLRTGMMFLPAGQDFKPVVLRARIASQLFCPGECGTILECSRDGQELYCCRCKAAFKTPTIEIHPIDHVIIRPQSGEHTDEAHCPNCNADTQQTFVDAGHERDSSGNRQECLTCGWYRYGAGEFQAPLHIMDSGGD